MKLNPDRLPAGWKREFARLRGRVAYLEKEVEALKKDRWTSSGLLTGVTLGDRFDDVGIDENRRMACGTYQSIRATIGRNFIDAYGVQLGDGLGIEVYGNLGVEKMVVLPKASNLIVVTWK